MMWIEEPPLPLQRRGSLNTLAFDIELFMLQVVKERKKGESNEDQNYLLKLFIRCYFNNS
jgi:hypothetical protein